MPALALENPRARAPFVLAGGANQQSRVDCCARNCRTRITHWASAPSCIRRYLSAIMEPKSKRIPARRKAFIRIIFLGYLATRWPVFQVESAAIIRCWPHHAHRFRREHSDLMKRLPNMHFALGPHARWFHPQSVGGQVAFARRLTPARLPRSPLMLGSIRHSAAGYGEIPKFSAMRKRSCRCMKMPARGVAGPRPARDRGALKWGHCAPGCRARTSWSACTMGSGSPHSVPRGDGRHHQLENLWVFDAPSSDAIATSATVRFTARCRATPAGCPDHRKNPGRGLRNNGVRPLPFATWRPTNKKRQQ